MNNLPKKTKSRRFFLRRLKLGTKISIVATVLILVGTGSSVYLFSSINQEALKDSIGENSVMLTQEIMDKIDRDIYSRIERWQSYAAANPGLQETLSESNQEFENLDGREEYIEKTDTDWQEGKETAFIQGLLSNELAERLRGRIEFYEEKEGYKVFPEAYVANKYGVIIASTGRTSDYLQADEEWYQTAVKEKKFWVGEVEYDESSDVYASDIVINLYDEKGEFVGILKVVLNIEEVVQIIKELELNGERAARGHEEHKTEVFKLLTHDGKIIYATEEYEFLEIIYEELLAYFEIDNHFDYFIFKGDKPSGKEKLFGHAHSRGYRDYKGLGWILILEHETGELFAPIVQARNRMLMVGFLIAVITLPSVLFVASRVISKPIGELVSATKVIAAGDLSKRAKVKSEDELGQLANSFNKMIKAIKKSRADVDKKVAKQTKELRVKQAKLEKQHKASEEAKWAMMNLLEDARELETQLKKEKKGIERKVIERTEELRKIQKRELAIKDEFVFIATHDLSAPVTAVIGYLDFIKASKEKFSEDTQKSFKAIEESAGRLGQLVEDLLQVARSESGTIKVEVSPVNIDELVETSIRQISLLAKEKNIRIKSELDQNNKNVLADDEKLSEVMENLLSNAVKFNSDGGRVDVKSVRVDNKLQVSVADTGYGIPKAQQGKVFQKFFRARGKETKKVPGTGLGLFVVRMLVEKMKGDITFTSEEGKGTTFTFALPVASKSS